MNQASQAFRRVVHDALLKARLPVGQFYDDLEEFFTATLSDEDSTEDIAAKALCGLCTEDGRFNNRTVFVTAVWIYLSTHAQGPVERDTAECMQALREVLAENCTYESARSWVREWFTEN